MNHISLFAGLGGFDLASEWTGWRNVASVEIGDFPNKILEYHFPNAIHERDITKVNYTLLNEKISQRFGSNWRSDGLVLSGGFPCQGFSVAGLRLGTEDDRFLWPEYLRAIDAFNPDWITGENVTGILSMEDKSGIYRDVFAKVEHRKITRFPEIDYYEAVYTRQAKLLVNSICESLEERGYEVQTFAIPAAGVGAPHKRERIWFIAHRANAGPESLQRERGDAVHGFEPIANSNGAGIQATGAEFKTTRAEQHGELGTLASHTECNGSSRCGHGETGCEASESEGQTYQRKRVRSKSQRTGGEGIVADTKNLRQEPSGNTWHGRSGFKNGHSYGNDANSDNINGRIEPQFGSSDQEGSRDQSEREDTSTSTNTNSERGRSGNDRREYATDVDAHSKTAGHGNDFDGWPIESPLCLRDDGFSEGLDGLTFSKWKNESIKGFGNALVPQIPFEIFKIIDTLSKKQ